MKENWFWKDHLIFQAKFGLSRILGPKRAAKLKKEGKWIGCLKPLTHTLFERRVKRRERRKERKGSMASTIDTPTQDEDMQNFQAQLKKKVLYVFHSYPSLFFLSFSLQWWRRQPRSLKVEHASSATWLLEKRREMQEVQQVFEFKYLKILNWKFILNRH